MAKAPKYMTVKAKGDDRRLHRVLGGANTKGTAANAATKSAAQSNASKGVGASKSSGPGGGSLSAPSRTAPSKASQPGIGGGGGGKGGSNVGTQKSSTSGPKSPMSGQGTSYKSPEAAKAGNTKAINKSFMDNTRKANEARKTAEAVKGFGPRVGTDKTANTITPSSMAAQNTLNRIAQGSIVSDTPALGKIQDRVAPDPQRMTRSTAVNLQQTPTVERGPNRGLGAASGASENLFEGANSPLAGVDQYNRDTYNQPRVSNYADQGYGQYRSPPAPTTGAYEQALGRIAAAADPTGVPMPSGRAYSATQQAVPRAPQRLAAPSGTYFSNPTVASAPPQLGPVADPRVGYTSPNNVPAAAPVAASEPSHLGGNPSYSSVLASQYASPNVRVPGIMGNTAGLAGVDYGDLTNTTSAYPAAAPVASMQGKLYNDRVVNIPGVGTRIVSGEQIAAMTPEERNLLDAAWGANQTPKFTPAPGVNAAAMPSGAYFGSPTVSPAQGDVTDAVRAVTEADVADMGTYSPTVQKLMEPVQSYVADKLGSRVAPSQQDSWMGRLDQGMRNVFGNPSPSSEYERVRAMAGNRSSNEGYQIKAPAMPATPASSAPAAPPPPALQPLPPYVNYQQLPSYAGYGAASASQPVLDFVGQYGGGTPYYPTGGYARGGGIGDGIDAAIRIAKHFSQRAK